MASDEITVSNTEDGRVVFDVVILSFAKTDSLRRMTEHCLQSLLASESPEKISFEVVVVESNHASPRYDYEGVETVYLSPPFNYHRYMNYGIKRGSSPFVAICNNDLSFHQGWASSLLRAFASDESLYSVSPACSLHHPRNGFELGSGIHYGHGVLREISGWCLVFKRQMLDITGMLDERFYFWYADDDYARTLKEKGITHGLVTDSVVDHLDSQTLKTHSTLRQWLMTKRSQYVFERKWSGKSRYYFFRKYLKLYLKIPLYLLGIKKIRN